MLLIEKIKAFFRKRNEDDILETVMQIVKDYAVCRRDLYFPSIKNTVKDMEFYIGQDVSDTCFRIYNKNDKNIGTSFPVADIQYTTSYDKFVRIKRIVVYDHTLFSYRYRQWRDDEE